MSEIIAFGLGMLCMYFIFIGAFRRQLYKACDDMATLYKKFALELLEEMKRK